MSTLLVVLPFTGGDLRLAAELLDWIDHLGGARENAALLIADCKLAPAQVDPIRAKSATVFKRVELIATPRPLPNEKWPAGPNWMFETCLRWSEQTRNKAAFLWLEPDCVPMREGWLRDIENAYFGVSKRKPFMGQVILPGLPKLPHEMLSGVAVYPADAHKTMLKKVAEERMKRAFDVSTAELVVGQTIHSRLIWNFHGEENMPPTFVKVIEKGHPKNALPLSAIPKPTVLFHRCKDSSLMNLLRGDSDATIPQILMAWKMQREIGKAGAVNEAIGHVPAVAGAGKSASDYRFFHVCERHQQRNVADDIRVATAVRSWIGLYKTGRVIPRHLWEHDYPRSASQLGDKRDLPYFKDVITEGLTGARDNDVILWTNDDTVLHPRVITALEEKLARVPCVSSFRVNFNKISDEDLKEPPHTLWQRGEKNADGTLRLDLGRDLFAWRKSWLVEHWLEIPDFLLGELEFDVAMAVMIRKEAGIFTDKRNVLQIMPSCELERGFVIHKLHERQWTSKEAKDSAAKIHNKRAAIQWYAENSFPSLISTF
jgi:hypothetical protein